ncbi:MAG: hypothetical protein A3B07_01650 [Candidatus Yonathbacteria bacterium RIFCSPLOWO2_01_FULL_43_27]|uniref:Uncharacterized protein n=1 Tax=Candidatus Yonathbacteria bacterium RIFCSPLOWO2_01_FULL_43_27 TaxID=1802726 RepID=A0A1G2SD98_9BACT|nr:MAG: hypothetical protein A2658_01445 [Candidatus Yonathbacteria bacterium RIFCSPHIGHO2_01_FULL_44_19]OHA82619.1 MAG: hypothetical protein A3B07_01650 [Candidatus Yonathbacteria bacterium RIFCSPLOWO2_01_FULL_43_27]
MEIRTLLKKWFSYACSLTGLWVIVVIAVVLRLDLGPEKSNEILRMFIAAVLAYFIMRLVGWSFWRIFKNK